MQTIGERLEEARKKKGISIREAAEATKIRGDYLQKFESNHFDIGLTEIYTRGFLRTYSNFLKVPADRILSDYAGLGRGEVRPRQPSREIYGRMDISVATAEAAERTPAAEEKAAPSPEPSHANRGPARSRTGSSLPTGPDPAVIFKYVKWAGVAIIALLVILILKSLFSGARSPGPATASVSPSNVPSRGSTIGISAIRPVQVTVRRRNADESDGEIIFSGGMAAGQTRTVARPGALYVEADIPENLDIEVNGRHFNLGEMLAQFGPGYKKALLPAPPPP
jgi:cytoskeleton protein RodZ